MRVQSIIRELRGEKIDIIEYHEDSVTFAEKALQPAKVSRVSIVDAGEKHLEVIVDDTQLSLAIGKKGQNVRLAAKLLGWKIDIKSEEEKRQEVEQQMSALVGGANTPLETLADQIGAGVVEKLREAGVTTIEGLADMHPEQLEELPGIGPKTVEKISVAVQAYFSSLEGGDTVADVDDAAAEGASEAEATETGPDSGGQSGDNTGLSTEAVEASESVDELAETGQDYEAEAVAGVEDAPLADEAEVTTHAERTADDEESPDKQ
jgi:transcription termination/antitermination protein NusA